MINFKLFRSAGSVLEGIELTHMIRKGQFAIDGAFPSLKMVGNTFDRNAPSRIVCSITSKPLNEERLIYDQGKSVGL